MKISFVIPCYYSEKTIAGVVEDIIYEFGTSEYELEIILVNDGSKDKTFDVLRELADKYNCIITINLSKNFGQDAACMAGYSCCTGDYIVTLDDDGQNPPKETHKMLNKLIEEEYDVVFGKYHKKKDSHFKTWGSKVNDMMCNIMLGKPKELSLCSFFVMTSFISNEITKYVGSYPYIWGLILRCTDNVGNEYVEHYKREIGKSTYSIRKLISYWLNGFTSFSVKPLRISAFGGSLIALSGFLYAFYIIISSIINGTEVQGWASLMTVVLILAGIQLIVIGLLGEYVGRIFINANNSPQYVIKEKYVGRETCESNAFDV